MCIYEFVCGMMLGPTIAPSSVRTGTNGREGTPTEHQVCSHSAIGIRIHTIYWQEGDILFEQGHGTIEVPAA